VPDPAGTGELADPGDDVVRGEALWFIDDYEAA